jgi:DNA-binding transcriptional regulator GbsR (MarR family)
MTKLGMAKATEKVLAAITANGPVMPKGIKEQTGLSDGYISDILNNLLRTRQIRRTAKGYEEWRPVGYPTLDRNVR